MRWYSVDRKPIFSINQTISDPVLAYTAEGTVLLVCFDIKSNFWRYLNMKKMPHTVTIKYWAMIEEPTENNIYYTKEANKKGGKND